MRMTGAVVSRTMSWSARELDCSGSFRLRLEDFSLDLASGFVGGISDFSAHTEGHWPYRGPLWKMERLFSRQ